MKNLAFAAVLAGVTTLMACGGDDDDDIQIVDAGPTIDAAPIATVCDPVNQEGCEEGEKCAQLTVAAGPPELNRTDCVPAGEVEVGAPCALGAPGETSGFDDCAAGAQCVNGVCRPICSSPPDTCEEGFSCSFFVDLFDDIMTDQVGVCTQICDPILQDCVIEGEGCYLSVFDEEGQATCVGIPDDSVGKAQGDLCNGPDDESCYLNGCDAGFWAVVPVFTVQPDKSPCARFCQPVNTYLVDPDGDGVGELVEGNDADGLGIDDDKDPKTPAIECSAGFLGVADQECRFFQAIGFSDLPFDFIPEQYGFCADTGVGEASIELWGKCELDSEERIARIFDEAEAAAPNTGNDAIDTFCSEDPDGLAGACAVGCISDAKAEELFDAYCKLLPVDPSAFCGEPAARARFMEHRRQRTQRAIDSLAK